MKANLGKTGEREGKQYFDEMHARSSKVEGVSLKGDFEQRRTGRCKAGNKAACFVCGNTDRFDAQFPILQAGRKRWGDANPTSGTKGGSQKRGTI